MSNPIKRTTARQVYNSGLLSSFTDSELKHITTSGANKPILQETAWVTPTYSKNEAGINTGITGYTIRFPNGTPGIKNGKPTDETMDYLIANAEKLNISEQELGVMIRERHGISTAYRDPTSLLPNSFSYGGGSLDFQTGILKNYAYNQTAARKIIKETNQQTLNVSSLIEQGILEQKEATKTEKNEITGEYGPKDSLNPEKINILYHTQAGKYYNPWEGVVKIYQQESGGNDASIEAIKKEVDHIGSGYITRDPKDGKRINENGEISGAMPLYAIATVAPPDGGDGTSIVGVVKDGTKVLKITGQAFTWSAILGEAAIAGKLLPKESMLAHAIHRWMGVVEGPTNSHGHHNPHANLLIAVKSVYGLLKGIKEGSVTTTVVEAGLPYLANFVIHEAGPRLAEALVRSGFRSVTSAGAILALDFIWLTWDLGGIIKDAIEAYKKGEEERQKLKETALKNGWDVGTFIASNGKIALPVKIFYWNPSTGRYEKPKGTININGKTIEVPPDNTVPVGIPPIGYDKDRNPIYPSPQNINPNQVPRRPDGKPHINRPPLSNPPQSPNLRDQFKFRPIQKDNLSSVFRTDDGTVYTAILNDDGTPSGYYQGVSVHGDAKEAVYASSINNAYSEQKQQNYLDNLLTYRVSVEGRSIAAGPVLTSNGNPPTSPDDIQKQIDKELEFIRAVINYDAWWVTMSGMGNANVSINMIPEPAESSDEINTGGGGAIIDSSAMPRELAVQTRADGDYYINSSHNTFRIYKGNAIVVNKDYQPYNRFG